MNEWLMIASMGLSGTLGAIGGTGPKWVRRFLLPFLLGVICLLAGVAWLKCIGLWLGLTAVFHLGYGEKYPYWAKFLVGISYILPTLFLGFSYWQILTPIIFILVFWLSNQKWASNTFVWKISEFIIFSCVGITIASLIK